MPTRRKKPEVVAPVPPAPAQPRPPEHPAPPWAEHRSIYGYPHKLTVRQTCAGDWHLPPFQREAVWDAERQVAYCNSLWDGLPTAPFLVWERYLGGGVMNRINVVLDGQQRLTALGAPVLRADGTANPPSGAFFDLEAGRFTTEPGRWALTAKDLCCMSFSDHFHGEPNVADEMGSRLWQWKIYAKSRLDSIELVSHVLESCTKQAEVVKAFRSINRPGIVFTEEEVERLIASVVEW